MEKGDLLSLLRRKQGMESVTMEVKSVEREREQRIKALCCPDSNKHRVGVVGVGGEWVLE